MIRIEELKKADAVELERITALMQELHDDDRTPTAVEAQAIFDNKNVLVMAVRDDEQIVGLATLYIIQKFGKLSAHLEDVIVDEKYRGQGLGKLLVLKIIDEAKKRGVESIALTSQYKRVAAHKLYESVGFVKRETGVFKLKLT